MGVEGTAVALGCIRGFTYAMLAYSGFYHAMFIGKWYESTILTDDQLEMVLDSADADLDGRADLYIRHSQTSKFVFIGVPLILAAALGGAYEALWKRQEIRSINKGNSNNSSTAEDLDNRPGILTFVKNVIHYQFRPLGRYSPWLTVGETTVLVLWVIAMGAQCWQAVMNHGNHFHDFNIPCADDPTQWCNMYTGEGSPTPNQYRFRMIGIFMGLVASSHFAIILVPVSRDSKIWSAVGIPFERAVLYHAIAGHLAFSSMFMHAFLMTAHWINYKGWQHAVDMSIHFDPDTHGGVDTPAGWMAALCALPMWVTSINWVRRKYYSLFKLAHWLFIGVFVFSMMHWAPNGLYFIGGLALYTVHVFSRLESWKRWRYWNRWFSSDPAKASPTSLVSVATNDSYTRLVLRNPKGGDNATGDFSARGGSFVYIAVPAALGTDEAHAITVALRGAPPSFSPSSSVNAKAPLAKTVGAAELDVAQQENNVFTVYIKDLGKWTNALKLAAKGAEATGDPRSLLVDVDGFYTQVQSLKSMMAEGSPRVVIVAGGSGMTSVMGFIQDWCVAASEGADVPEVHLAWCCRFMSEFELVGESLPSLLASAGSKKDTHFSMSLYCTKPSSHDGALSVTWPMDTTIYARSTTQDNVIGTNYVAAGLNHAARVILAGLACYAGYILGFYEVDRRDLMNVFHEGAIIFVMQIICMISALVIYDGIAGLVSKHTAGNKAGVPAQGGGGSSGSREESKMDIGYPTVFGGGGADSTVTYEVKRGRMPTRALLVQEAETAKKTGASTVKVLTSGPNSLVDQVLKESRSIDWQLFDAEAFSFEF